MKYVIILASMTLCLCSCVAGGSTELGLSRVSDRAVWELDCPKEKLTINKLNDSTVGVLGCNKKVTYVLHECHPTIDQSLCTAVLDSVIEK